MLLYTAGRCTRLRAAAAARARTPACAGAGFRAVVDARTVLSGSVSKRALPRLQRCPSLSVEAAACCGCIRQRPRGPPRPGDRDRSFANQGAEQGRDLHKPPEFGDVHEAVGPHSQVRLVDTEIKKICRSDSAPSALCSSAATNAAWLSPLACLRCTRARVGFSARIARANCDLLPARGMPLPPPLPLLVDPLPSHAQGSVAGTMQTGL